MSRFEQNIEDAVEQNFRLGVVTAVYDDCTQVLMLHSRAFNSPPTEYSLEEDEFNYETSEWVVNSGWHRGAVDTDLPEVFELIDILEEIKERDIGIPEGRTIATHAELWSNDDLPGGIAVETGSIIHEHDYGDGGCTYCVNPRPLTGDGIVSAVARANKMRKQRVQDRIEELDQEETRLGGEAGVYPASNGLRLFEEVQQSETNGGRPALSIPSIAIRSEKYGYQDVSAWSWPVRIDEAEDAGHLRFTTGGSIFWVPDIFLFEEVDERGVPTDLGKEWVRLEISIDSPVRRHPRALEEEKLLLECGGKTYWAEPCPDMLVGNQGFGGVDFNTFHDSGQPDRYYEIRQSPNNLTLPPRYRNAYLVVAIDNIDALREAIIRLPGLEG